MIASMSHGTRTGVSGRPRVCSVCSPLERRGIHRERRRIRRPRTHLEARDPRELLHDPERQRRQEDLGTGRKVQRLHVYRNAIRPYDAVIACAAAHWRGRANALRTGAMWATLEHSIAGLAARVIARYREGRARRTRDSRQHRQHAMVARCRQSPAAVPLVHATITSG